MRNSIILTNLKECFIGVRIVSSIKNQHHVVKKPAIFLKFFSHDITREIDTKP